MALQMNYENTSTGISKTNAYWRVSQVLPTNGEKVEIAVKIYGSETLCNHGKGIFFDTRCCQVPRYLPGEESENVAYTGLMATAILPAAYVYLKTLTEYATATDV